MHTNNSMSCHGARAFTTPPVRFSRTRYINGQDVWQPPEDATGTIARTWQPVTSGNTTKWTAWSDEDLDPDDTQGHGTTMRIELTRKALGAPVGNFLASIFAGAAFEQIADQFLEQGRFDEDIEKIHEAQGTAEHGVWMDLTPEQKEAARSWLFEVVE